jgi:hypothetical protein
VREVTRQNVFGEVSFHRSYSYYVSIFIAAAVVAAVDAGSVESTQFSNRDCFFQVENLRVQKRGDLQD